MTRLYHVDGTLPDYKCIFVFGSNLAGIHGAGAAKVAYENYGAELHKGLGRVGDSYAIPTKDAKMNTLSLEAIRTRVNYFLIYAANDSSRKFFITRIGCGLAGYKDADIAPMFKRATYNCDMPEDWMRWVLQ